MDYEFKSLKELYERIKPALKARRNEFKKIGLSEVSDSDIWNYLTENKWKITENLTLSEMVNDIFEVKYDDVVNNIIRKVSKDNRDPNFND